MPLQLHAVQAMSTSGFQVDPTPVMPLVILQGFSGGAPEHLRSASAVQRTSVMPPHPSSSVSGTQFQSQAQTLPSPAALQGPAQRHFAGQPPPTAPPRLDAVPSRPQRVACPPASGLTGHTHLDPAELQQVCLLHALTQMQTMWYLLASYCITLSWAKPSVSACSREYKWCGNSMLATNAGCHLILWNIPEVDQRGSSCAFRHFDMLFFVSSSTISSQACRNTKARVQPESPIQ